MIWAESLPRARGLQYSRNPSHLSGKIHGALGALWFAQRFKVQLPAEPEPSFVVQFRWQLHLTLNLGFSLGSNLVLEVHEPDYGQSNHKSLPLLNVALRTLCFYPAHSMTTSKIPVDMSSVPKDYQDFGVYDNPLALGGDSAHIIITCPISDIYVWYLMSATGYTSSEFMPGYPWPIQSAPYNLQVWPVVLSGLYIHGWSGCSARTPCMVAHHQG